MVDARYPAASDFLAVSIFFFSRPTALCSTVESSKLNSTLCFISNIDTFKHVASVSVELYDEKYTLFKCLFFGMILQNAVLFLLAVTPHFLDDDAENGETKQQKKHRRAATGRRLTDERPTMGTAQTSVRQCASLNTVPESLT